MPSRCERRHRPLRMQVALLHDSMATSLICELWRQGVRGRGASYVFEGSAGDLCTCSDRNRSEGAA